MTVQICPLKRLIINRLRRGVLGEENQAAEASLVRYREVRICNRCCASDRQSNGRTRSVLALRQAFASLEAMKRAIFLSACLLLAVFPASGCGPARVREPKPRLQQAKTFPVRYVIKLTPEAWRWFDKEDFRGELTPDRLPVEALKVVSEQRNILIWKPVYPVKLEADVVGLNRMYLLISENETDPKATVNAFETLNALVEYIEESRSEP